MTIEQVKDNIQGVICSEAMFGLNLYACLKKDKDLVLKEIQITNVLRKDISALIKSVVSILMLSDEAEIDSVDNIADNRKILYEVPQTESYHPFSFLEIDQNQIEYYNEEDQKSLVGYAFRVNKNDYHVWFYQQVYPVRLLKRSLALYAILNTGTTYTILDKEIFKIEPRIDIAIIDGSIITARVDLLQKSFGFEKYVRNEAKKTIDRIGLMNLLRDTAKLEELIKKEKLTVAKKLMKVQNSPVFSMQQTELIASLQQHPRYKDKFVYENNKIVIQTQKAACEFIKMLNDDIVRSDLTNQEYDSSSKQILSPLIP